MMIVCVENAPGSNHDAAADAPMTVVVHAGDAERTIAIIPRATQVGEFYFEKRP